MFCFTVFLVLKLSSALFFFYVFLFYTSNDDEVVEANSRTRTFAISGQAPPLQLGFNFCLNDSLKTCKYLQIFYFKMFYSWTGTTFATFASTTLRKLANIFQIDMLIYSWTGLTFATGPQLLLVWFFENLQIFLQLQISTTSLTSTATTWMSICPDAGSKWSLEIP